MPLLRRTPARRTATSLLSIEVAGETVDATVVRSSRRRRTIAVGVHGGAVRVLAPLSTSDAQVREVVQSRWVWLSARLREARSATIMASFEPGRPLPFRGEALTLSLATSSRRSATAKRAGSEIVVTLPRSSTPGDRDETVRRALVAWYRSQALAMLPALVDAWAARTGLVPVRLAIRDQRRRWGSCGADGAIRLNWRLILLEPELADYVVVHELAHLRHQHHQPAFWDEVARWLPGHRELRKRLNAASAAAHQFDPPH